MIFHHFYYDDKVIQNDSVYSFLQAYSMHAKACVAIFAFITGYGYYAVSKKDYGNCFLSGIKRISRFYPFFLFMCTLHIVLGYFFPYGNVLQPDNWKAILLNMVGLKGSIPDYWYIRVVLLAALVYYPILLYVNRKQERTHLLTLFILLVATVSFHYLYEIASCCMPQELLSTQWMDILLKSTHCAMYLLFFIAGWATNYSTVCRNKYKFIVPAIGWSICLIISASTTITVAVCILLAVALPQLSNRGAHILALLGACSMSMWLNHRLIYGYWFSSWFFSIPSPLNYALLVILSYATALLTMKVWDKITR